MRISALTITFMLVNFGAHALPAPIVTGRIDNYALTYLAYLFPRRLGGRDEDGSACLLRYWDGKRSGYRKFKLYVSCVALWSLCNLLTASLYCFQDWLLLCMGIIVLSSLVYCIWRFLYMRCRHLPHAEMIWKFGFCLADGTRMMKVWLRPLINDLMMFIPGNNQAALRILLSFFSSFKFLVSFGWWNLTRVCQWRVTQWPHCTWGNQ